MKEANNDTDKETFNFIIEDIQIYLFSENEEYDMIQYIVSMKLIYFKVRQ